jgi:hypothetical protein
MARYEDFERIIENLKILKKEYSKKKSDVASQLKDIAESCGYKFLSEPLVKQGFMLPPKVLDYAEQCKTLVEQCKGLSDIKLLKIAKELLALINHSQKPGMRNDKTDYKSHTYQAKRRPLGFLTTSKSTWKVKDKDKSQSVLFDGNEFPKDNKEYWDKHHLIVQVFNEKKIRQEKTIEFVKVVDVDTYDDKTKIDERMFKEEELKSETEKKKLTEMTLGKYLLNQYFENPNVVISCHPTAIGLRNLMGQKETEETAGGAGKDNREAAIRLAQRALDDPLHLYIIQVKGCASDDGHSFSLLMNYNRTVSVLEGWAMSSADSENVPCTLARTWLKRHNSYKLKQYLTIDETKKYLNLILSDLSLDRDNGYKQLSSAYSQEPSLGFEKNTQHKRDDRKNHSIVVTLRELRPYDHVMERMRKRWEKLNEILK